MDLGLTGRVAFVAAASKGLGKAAARALASEGMKVVVSARGEETLRATASELASATRAAGSEIEPVPCDLLDAPAIEAAIARTVARFGRLDVLVANGGGPRPGTFSALSEDDWRHAIDGTLLSTVRLIRAALPHLRASGQGRVLVITSTSTKEPIAGLLLSNVLRPGLVGLCKTLAKELGPDGITVNNVAPGSFDTDRMVTLHARIAQAQGISEEEARARTDAAIPLGRMGRPEELAATLAFLASARASYVSGQTIVVDGGRTGAY